LPLGAALHRTLVEGAGDDGGRHSCAAGPGNAAGRGDQPLLANLFLHYVFDVWLKRAMPGIPFERYADDIVCHCRTEREALALRQVLDTRFSECGLMLHPEKTKLVYCKDTNRKRGYGVIQFDFLGYTFRPRFEHDHAV
jgi:hypothetical protein